ncbi:MAG: DUF533 domain-containing protein [Polyangiaceae bacterium]|nr:DUF533 domain-containing protein [Polyangiaceae bacterium]
MTPQDIAIVKSLVSVAWADGEFHDKEKEMVDALISAFDANEAEAEMIRMYAAEKRTLDDVPVDEISEPDRRVLLQHAVLLTYVDKEQHEAEKQYLGALSKKLGIPDDEVQQITAAAESRAKRFLNLL